MSEYEYTHLELEEPIFEPPIEAITEPDEDDNEVRVIVIDMN